MTESKPVISDAAACKGPGCLLRKPRWNPYLVGVGIGMLSWLVFGIADKPLGISTSLSAASGACLIPITGADAVKSTAYWKRHFPKWDYGMLFLVGTLAGALISSIISRSFAVETVPTVWAERFGPSVGKRFLAAFVGGILAMYGARLAGGCTSGNGISGSLQLAVSGWTFFIVMFISGVITAAVLFRRRA